MDTISEVVRHLWDEEVIKNFEDWKSDLTMWEFGDWIGRLVWWAFCVFSGLPLVYLAFTNLDDPICLFYFIGATFLLFWPVKSVYFLSLIPVAASQEAARKAEIAREWAAGEPARRAQAEKEARERAVAQERSLIYQAEKDAERAAEEARERERALAVRRGEIAKVEADSQRVALRDYQLKLQVQQREIQLQEEMLRLREREVALKIREIRLEKMRNGEDDPRLQKLMDEQDEIERKQAEYERNQAEVDRVRRDNGWDQDGVGP